MVPDVCDFLNAMEFLSVFFALLFSGVIILLLILLAAGIACIFGASFAAVFKGGLWALLLPPALILYGWLVERNIYVVRQTGIVSERLPESFDGYRIVHISDLHLRSFRHRLGSLSRAVDRINDLGPDIIMFTGDLVTSYPDEIAPCMEILSRLKARDGVVSVMGNHDYCPYSEWPTQAMREAAVAEIRGYESAMGWHLLDDSHIELTRAGADGEDTISVIGVENISAMPRFETHGNLDRALTGAAGDFKILLSHDPTHWRSEVLARTDIGLTLSGHTHNAQFSFFGLEPSRLVFRENSGLYQEESSMGVQYLYVNDGLGETIFPARIGVPPEITVITLRCR